MKPTEIINGLKAAFRGLDDEQLSNFKRNVEGGKRILCGPKGYFNFFSNGAG